LIQQQKAQRLLMINNSQLDVLLVEDDANDAELILRVLESAPLQLHVRWIPDGVMALEFLNGSGGARQLPKVVFMDIKMPKMNGIETLSRIRTIDHLKHLPVVVLTSSAVEIDVHNCYQLGVNSYLVKPVDYALFSETIRLAGQYWAWRNQICATP
jgi:two-component system response regulator